MMAAERLPPKVERLRRHREEMQLALRENLTLDQARERLASYQAHRPRLETDPRPSQPLRADSPTLEEERPLPWWMRD